MKFNLISTNKIEIGNEKIIFPNETVINKVEALTKVVCLSTSPLESDLDWSNIKTHQIWKRRCLNNPSKLFCYDFNGELIWKLPYDFVVGFGQIIPELKKESEFSTPKHYKKYIKNYIGKELLEVYAGNHRFVVDANTGEVYDKIESR